MRRAGRGEGRIGRLGGRRGEKAERVKGETEIERNGEGGKGDSAVDCSWYLVVLKENHNKWQKAPAWVHALQDWPRPTLCQICILHLPLKGVHHGLGLLLQAFVAADPSDLTVSDMCLELP